MMLGLEAAATLLFWITAVCFVTMFVMGLAATNDCVNRWVRRVRRWYIRRKLR